MTDIKPIDDASATSARRLGRPKAKIRVPLVEQRDKLTVENRDPNFVYRWVNDVEDRINKFKLAGYDVVQEPMKVGDTAVETGQDKTSSLTTKAVGGQIKAVLMRIPKEWYEEDQDKKQKANNAIDEAMKRDQKDKSDYGTVQTARK